MSLSFTFKLTPAQTRFLVLLAYEVRQGDCALVDWPRVNGVPDHYVSIAKNLESKGLAHHDINRDPSLVATDEGRALAAMIVRDAQKIAAVADGLEERKKRWKPKPTTRRVPLP